MITAIRKVHGEKGLWNTGGGYEYNAVLLAALLALTEMGPGRYSVDARAFPRLRGPRLAIAQLACALAASEIATSEPLNEPSEEIEPGEADGRRDDARPAERVPVTA